MSASNSGPRRSSERRGAAEARWRRKTVSILKRAGISAPDLETGRILEVMARADLFDRGAVLVGTAAFQTFPLLVGAHLPGAALTTQNVGIATARVAVAHFARGEHLDAILRRADASFVPRLSRGDTLPKQFSSERTGLLVEVLTTLGRSAGPVPIPNLGCSAVPLRFMEYLIADPTDVVVLCGAGTRIKVPDPARYAVDKLILHQVRTNRIKVAKNLLQARALIEVYRVRDPAAQTDAIDDAVGWGRTWAKLVCGGLRLV